MIMSWVDRAYSYKHSSRCLFLTSKFLAGVRAAVSAAFSVLLIGFAGQSTLSFRWGPGLVPPPSPTGWVPPSPQQK